MKTDMPRDKTPEDYMREAIWALQALRRIGQLPQEGVVLIDLLYTRLLIQRNRDPQETKTHV